MIPTVLPQEDEVCTGVSLHDVARQDTGIADIRVPIARTLGFELEERRRSRIGHQLHSALIVVVVIMKRFRGQRWIVAQAWIKALQQLPPS